MRKLICTLVLLFGLAAFPADLPAQNYDALFKGFSAESLSRADKRFLQTALAFEGYYNGMLDGDWGPRSQQALERYARKEFGTGAEAWHMAMLAYSFLDIYNRDGWVVRHLSGLNMSMLYPDKAVKNEPSTELFANWRHTNSSLSYSTGLHTLETVRRLHKFTAGQNVQPNEIYVLRRSQMAITTATLEGGGVLYTRSDFFDGVWHTVMLSADASDVPILTAVAASISVGIGPSITVTTNGRLMSVLVKTAELLKMEEVATDASRKKPPQSEPTEPQRSTGTGFVVAANGFVLTNAHVTKSCKTIKFNSETAELIADSSEFDLALLHVPSWKGTNIAKFSPTPAKLNSDVTVAGFPLAGILSGLNITRGAVSSQKGYGGEIGGMQITAPVQPGNSGGPLIAADGEVVGVVVGKLNAQLVADATGDIPQNVNFAIRGELAKLFLFQNGVYPSLGSSDEPLPPVDLAELATGYTGFIECN